MLNKPFSASTPPTSLVCQSGEHMVMRQLTRFQFGVQRGILGGISCQT